MKYIEKINLALLTTVIFCLSMAGCDSSKKDKGGDENVSADLVTNPVTASGKKTKSDLPLMDFVSEEHDFGLIVQGETVSHTFRFKNIGASDLIISSASATCGCTVPKFSKEPVRAGGEGTIVVEFDSSGRSGANHKEVKVLCNGQPNTIKLGIRAEIFVPKKKVTIN